ncbi:23S rRNA (uracil(1939)-C(5))-methyltransferase RlmD [Fusicatenibacter saccharivorans]|uniref:23S rRNA (uracil(1939)-C(5))-methyltransferase RlmD n=1 Tax=Fusicatenibacter saccharivorans TaxID=1150298 RepID=UPI003CFCB17B
MLKKNDMAVVTISDMGVDGEGIGKVDGYTLFVKDAVIGDVVNVKVMKAKKQYGYARLMEIVEASPYRVKPVCPVARQCGGCQIQSLAYEKQLEFKSNKVRGNLIRIGGFEEDQIDRIMEPIAGMKEPYHYRNKAQYPIGKDKEGNLTAGFYAGRTHQIISNLDCALGMPVNRQILEKVLSYMEENHISAYDETTGKGLVRHVLIRCGFTTDEIMVCIVINGNNLPRGEKLAESLAEIPGMKSITYNINQENTNVIMGKEVRLLWGQEYITDYIGNVKYQISPLSFFQVNPVQTNVLYGQALEYAGLTGNETVWDVYCGIGTISLFLAQKAGKVYGVEIVPQAIEDAKKNAQINGIQNAEFFVGKAEDVLPDYYAQYAKEHPGETAHADVIVVDPPRKGCEESVLETMVNMGPERIVYVSCDSATLARDLKYLCGKGYELEKVRAVDMFPMTGHVETVVLLSQQKPDDVIEVDLDLDELDITSAESKATYQEIKDYVLKEFGLKVSTLYISQIKRKCGIEVGEHYNFSQKENQRVPQCPKEKEDAIRAALEHFAMI